MSLVSSFVLLFFVCMLLQLFHEMIVQFLFLQSLFFHDFHLFYTNREEDDAPQEKFSPTLKLPGFLDGLIKKPDEAWRNKQLRVFGIMTAICWVLPPMAEKIIMINWLFAAGQIGRRGTGQDIEAMGNPYAGKKSSPHQRTAIFLSMFVWIVLKVWTGLLGNIKYAFGPRYGIVIEATIMNLFLGIWTCYAQTYKGN